MSRPLPPIAVRELVIAALDRGWAIKLDYDIDSGDNPFLTFAAATEGKYLEATWHTRQTGTYRLFHASTGRNLARRDCSLRTLKSELGVGS